MAVPCATAFLHLFDVLAVTAILEAETGARQHVIVLYDLLVLTDMPSMLIRRKLLAYFNTFNCQIRHFTDTPRIRPERL